MRESLLEICPFLTSKATIKVDDVKLTCYYYVWKVIPFSACFNLGPYFPYMFSSYKGGLGVPFSLINKKIGWFRTTASISRVLPHSFISENTKSLIHRDGFHTYKWFIGTKDSWLTLTIAQKHQILDVWTYSKYTNLLSSAHPRRLPKCSYFSWSVTKGRNKGAILTFQ